MFQFLRGIVLIGAVTLNCGGAFAEKDLSSANYMMHGCRADLLSHPPTAEHFRAGVCIGMIIGIRDLAPGVCSPDDVTNEQSVRVVIKYIDERPARMHEDFELLAYEALRAAWPCKK